MPNLNVPQIFIAHANEDKSAVRGLYDRLKQSGYKPWLDEKDLFPGQNWRDEIPKALKKSDFFLMCLSLQSINKKGYVQTEFKQAIKLSAEMPTGTIYLIPLKLDDCEIPDLRQNEYGINLRDLQWLNYWEPDSYEKLIKSIQHQWSRQSNSTSSLQDTNQRDLEDRNNVAKELGFFQTKELERSRQRYDELNKESKDLSKIINQLRTSHNFSSSASEKIDLERNIESKEIRLKECISELESLKEKIVSLE